MYGLWMALSLSLAGAFSAASDEAADLCGASAPSNFDYLVLARLADAQHPIGMVSYRAESRERADTPP